MLHLRNPSTLQIWERIKQNKRITRLYKKRFSPRSRTLITKTKNGVEYRRIQSSYIMSHIHQLAHDENTKLI